MAAKRSGLAPCSRCGKWQSGGEGAHKNNNYLVREPLRPSRRQGFQPWIYRSISYIVVCALACICYSNSLNGQLVHDDVFVIKNNPDVRPETTLSQVFRHDFWGKELTDNASHKSYRPLTILTFRLNYYLHGHEPQGYHVINLTLHMLVTCFFTHVCLTRVFKKLLQATMAGSLFAVHPIHTEAVSGVVGRADVLACLLVLLAFHVYTRDYEGSNSYYKKSWLSPLGCVVLASAAMFVKETGITVIGVCLVYDVITILGEEKRSWRVDRSSPPAVRLILMMIAAFSLVLFRMWLINGDLPKFTDQDNPASFSISLTTKYFTYSYLAAFNAWLLVCPSVLSYDWQMSSIPLIHKWTDVRNLSTCVLLSVLCLMAYKIVWPNEREERRIISVGTLLLVLPFMPASNIFFRVGFVVAERILYIPSLGYTVLLVHGLDRLSFKFGRKGWILYGAMFILVLLMAARTLLRNQVWTSREKLFLSGLQTLPHNAKMHYNYANLMKDMDERNRAMQHYKEAIRLWPRYASAFNNLGTLMENQTEAEELYQQAIGISDGTHAGAYFNLANLYYLQGRHQQAIAQMDKALRLDAQCSDIYGSMALILEEAGRTQDAEEWYEKMLRIKPHDLRLMELYAGFLTRIKHYEKSLSLYRNIYSLNPTNQPAIFEAARLLRLLGRRTQAAELIDRILHKERSASAYDAAGVFHFNLGNLEKAVMLFQQAFVMDQQNTKIMVHLAQALASSGRYHEAVQYGHSALQLNPSHVEALQQMSMLCGFTGQHTEGLVYVNRALTLVTDVGARAQLLLEKGNHFKDIHDYTQAFQAFKEAVSLNSNLFEAQHSLGVLYHMQGNYSLAQRHYELAMRVDPENPVLLENIRKLKKIR